MSDLLLTENVENIDIQAPHSHKMKKNNSKVVGKHQSGRHTLTELKANTLRQHKERHFVVYEDKDKGKSKDKPSSNKKDQKVQCEPIEMKSAEAQTTLSGKSMDNAEAVAFMYQEESGDDNYWKDLAEKRLEALNESLNENEGLHIENADLHYQVSTLQENLKAAEEIVKEVKALCMSSNELIQTEDGDEED